MLNFTVKLLIFYKKAIYFILKKSIITPLFLKKTTILEKNRSN